MRIGFGYLLFQLEKRLLIGRRILSLAVAIATIFVILFPAGAANATVPGLAGGGILGIDLASDPVVFNPVDGNRTTLMKSGYSEDDPAWAPSGSAFVVSSGMGLVTANLDGSNQVTIDAAVSLDPAWSPDGSEIAFTEAWPASNLDHLAVMDASGGTVTAVPNTDGMVTPEWSPDGQWIVGAMPKATGDQSLEIWKIHPDGTGLTQLTDRDGDQLNPTLSPDGSMIAFEDRNTADYHTDQIGVVSSTPGGVVTDLTSAAHPHWWPSWSPDGNEILFGMFSKNHWWLYTMATDGSDIQQVPLSEGIKEASWQPAQVVLDASKQIVKAGGTVNLHVQIAAPGTDQPSVSIERRTTTSDWSSFRTVDVDGTGAAVTPVTVREKTWFRAVWQGDATHVGGSSVFSLVQARVIVEGHLFRFYSTSGEWHLYHVGKPVWYTSKIEPNHAGKKMCFDLEHLKNGSWHSVGTNCFKIGKTGVTTVYIVNVPKGDRDRIRATFPGDSDHLGDAAPWAYFRVTT